MTDTLTTTLPAEAEADEARSERIWEAWATHRDFRDVSVVDAVWFIANAEDGWDWGDAFLSASYGKDGWPRASWDYDAMEPAETVEVLADLATEWECAKALATANMTKENLQAERNAYIAFQGLDQRFKRTRNDDMGW